MLSPRNQLLNPGSQATVPIIVGDVATFHAQGNTKNRANRAPGSFTIGMVIWAPHVAPCLNPKARSDDKTVGVTEIVGPISAKERPWAIFGILPLHGLLVVPMFTASGNGIQRIPEDKREDCILVVMQNDPEPYERGCRIGEALRVIATEPSFTLHKGSHVKVTEAALIPFAYLMRNAAMIDGASVETIRKWVKRFHAKGVLPFDQQESYFRRYADEVLTYTRRQEQPQSQAHERGESSLRREYDAQFSGIAHTESTNRHPDRAEW